MQVIRSFLTTHRLHDDEKKRVYEVREKVEFYTIKTDSQKEMSWVYSATEFQNVLTKEFHGQKLNRLFVRLYGYLASSKRSDHLLDFAYTGGTLLVIFERSVLELDIHTVGMMQYRILPFHEVNIPRHSNTDYPPPDTGSKDENYFYDLSHAFDLTFVETEVRKVEVNKTVTYPFELEGFDEAIAAEAQKRGDLPQDIYFYMDNGVLLKLCEDCNEYFYIELEKRVES